MAKGILIFILLSNVTEAQMCSTGGSCCRIQAEDPGKPFVIANA